MQTAAPVPVAKPAAGPVRSPWIVAPVADVLLVIATPIILMSALTAAKFVWTPAQITSFALVWAIGHHLPGMMRAYGDRALFQRFKTRFLVAPLVLIAVGIYSFAMQSSAIPLAVGFWGWWHYLMQAYGFIRIYDAKAGSVDPLTCRLDQAMCIAWFAAPIGLTSNGLFSDLNLFYKAGGPIVPTPTVQTLQYGLLIALIVVTSLFAAHTIRQAMLGRPPSWLKLALMASNFAYYWYCLATVSNLLISYALYELFHDVQYLTIVWAFNAQRAARDRTVGSFTQFLFRKRWWLIAAYVFLIVGYGSLNFATRTMLDGSLQRILLGIFLASTVLHYYYDGFIWKLRETQTRQSLGLDDAGPAAKPAWRPAWNWALPVMATCGLIFLVVQERIAARDAAFPPFPLEKHNSLVAALPDSVFAHYNRGLALAQAGRLDEAEAEYRRARELNPHYAEVPYNLAHIRLQQGKTDEALADYEAALRLDPRHIESNYNVGVLLIQRGKPRDAVRYLTTAEKLAPQRAEIQSNLGSALAMTGNRQDAIAHLRRAVELKPDLAEAHANLSQTLAATGKLPSAVNHARRAVELQPQSAAAHYNLGILLERLQQFDEAAAEYRKALEFKPEDGAYWNNLGVALAKQNRVADAVHAFRQAVNFNPNDPSARQNLQRAESLAGSATP